MSFKQVQSFPTIKDKIIHAVDTLNDPIRQTLSPRGGNVIIEDNNGSPLSTNDGVTIAKHITVKDRVENSIIEIMKSAAFSTNSLAGDGTSSTILFSSILIKEGLKLVEEGYNPIELRKAYDEFANKMVDALSKFKILVKNDQDLFHIAKISSSGDEEIASTVVNTVKVAGQDGMVFIEPSNSLITETQEDSGFNIAAGMVSPELRNNARSLAATYMDVPVLITDKRIYYAQEAETILSVALQNGYKEIVIVAKDFIGEALPFFVTNHAKGVVKVLLVKEPRASKDDNSALEDLAIYLGGHVVSDKTGSIVDELKIDDFVIAKKAYADGAKTLISRDTTEKNKQLDDHVALLKKEIKKFGSKETKEVELLKERLASLTNGIVTVKVGGSTPLEVNEKIYRYEDAVNATRAAMKDGFLVGGGLSILRAFREAKFKGDLLKVYRKVGEASVRQIAENCGLNGDVVLDTVTELQGSGESPHVGFDAQTLTYGDLLEAGVIDPYKVAEMSIRNAVSVAGVIVGSRYIITNVVEDDAGTQK